jgi:RNA polymerase sigma-70 factor, ECF subfamily
MVDAEAHESVTALLARLRPFVERRVPSPADANDVLQEVFVRMHRGLPRLRDSQRLGPWLYRLVRNVINDRYRAQARARAQAGDARIATLAPAPSADEPEVAGELAACIAPFVARLPSPYREAVTLVDLEGVTHKNAAPMLGVSLPGVKARVQRGRRKLRAMFEACCRIELDVRRRVTAYECAEGNECGRQGSC